MHKEASHKDTQEDNFATTAPITDPNVLAANRGFSTMWPRASGVESSKYVTNLRVQRECEVHGKINCFLE